MIIRKIPTKIPIRGIGSTIYYSNKFINLTFNLSSKKNNKLALAKITRKIYIIEDLKAGILIRADILILEYITIDFTNQ